MVIFALRYQHHGDPKTQASVLPTKSLYLKQESFARGYLEKLRGLKNLGFRLRTLVEVIRNLLIS